MSQFGDLRRDPDLLRGAVLGCLFETPSVRTKQGFNSAFMKLGGSNLDLDQVARRIFSGAGKESIEDVLETPKPQS